MDAFKAMFGVMAAQLVYFFIVFLAIMGVIGGAIMIVKANQNRKCFDDPPPTSPPTTRPNEVPQEPKCQKQQSIDDTSSSNKAKYYTGITLVVIFGLITLILLLPYILQGFAYFIGYLLADKAIDSVF